jgi:hypothetical protein
MYIQAFFPLSPLLFIIIIIIIIIIIRPTQ